MPLSGRKRPLVAVECEIAIAKIAIGEIDGLKAMKSCRTRSGAAGAKACCEQLSSEDRKKIAKKAASARWY